MSPVTPGLFLLVICFLSAVNCEIFTSSSDLESLIYLRREVNRAIELYIRKEEQRLTLLKQRHEFSRGLSRHRNSGGRSVDNDDSGNPINAFLLVKGLTLDLAEMVGLAGDRANFKEFGRRIEELHDTTSFPDLEDISGAALGLIRLQDTYKLDAHSLARGAIGDSCCTVELSVEDCFELGRQGYNAKHYDFAIQWFKEALYRLPPEGEWSPPTIGNISNETVTPSPPQWSRSSAVSGTKAMIKVSKAEIQDYLVWAEDIKKTLDLGKDFLSQLTGLKLDAFVEQVAQAVAGANDGTSMTHSELSDKYKALCRGDDSSLSSIDPKLKCYYSTRNHPYYFIGPIKEELLNVDPPIWSFKSVIHSGEIEKIKDLARPRFETAMIVNVVTGVNERSNSRISKAAWLTKQDDPLVHRIDTRTGLLTGLDMDTAEFLQIANYGIGGMYLPHYDFALPGQEASFLTADRNRIATTLFYMSDVEKGGATVFPKLNLTLWPEKGSAVFWYNLKRSGDGELRTQHAACPVLVGTKWVSNKWIHEKGQEFRHRCGLTRNE